MVKQVKCSIIGSVSQRVGQLERSTSIGHEARFNKATSKQIEHLNIKSIFKVCTRQEFV